jgi:pSer/pThr/pTyr-binding forkhead associated (FHA) protein
MDAKIFLIGRDEENDIIVSHITVSRFHAQIFRNENGECFLSDLSTPYGTFVNGKKITSDIKLKPHDRIFLGDNQLLNWTEPILEFNYIDLKSNSEIPKSDKRFISIIIFVLVLLFLITGGYILSLGIFSTN